MNKRLIFWGVVLSCLCHRHIALALPDYGYALDFDGVDDFVNVSYTPRLNVTGQLTVEAWVKPEAYSPGTYQMIARKGNSYYLGIYGSNPYCRINTNGWKAARSSFTLHPNTWYHLAMTYNKDTGGYEAAQDVNSFDMLIRNTLLVPEGDDSDWDEHIREIGNILYEPNCPEPNERYKFFYSGYKGYYQGNKVYVGYAYSADGNSWTKFGKVIARAAEDPYVVNRNGTYYLYAEDKEDVPFRNIRLYTSSDCKTWTDMGDVFDVQGGGNPPNWQSMDVSSPIVWVDDNDVWYLMYEGRGGGWWGLIGLAQSQDGINWVRCSDDPVMGYGVPGQWDDSAVVTDDIVKIDGVYYLLYHGYGSVSFDDFWAGMATSIDLHTWNRYRWNPITIEADTLMFFHNEDGHYEMVGEVGNDSSVPVHGVYRYRLYVASAPHLYVNGVEYSYTGRAYCNNAPNSTDALNFTIGKAPAGPPYYYKGLIDDVFLWSKALDQNEIADSMYSGVNCPEPNLIAYWPFDEISGYIAYDFCNGINGCLGGDCNAEQNSTPQRVTRCAVSAQCTVFEDLEEMAENWLGEVVTCSQGDRNGDGAVDFLDFAILADKWFSEECSR
jgi:predicted GH43/DUF377 family glycosyl hydrolase